MDGETPANPAADNNYNEYASNNKDSKNKKKRKHHKHKNKNSDSESEEKTNKEDEKNNQMILKDLIAENFVLLHLIGQGAFGQIYISYDMRENVKVSIKKEIKRPQKIPQLRTESKIYQSLLNIQADDISGAKPLGQDDVQGVPKFYGVGELPDSYYMIIDFLGPNLIDLFNFCGCKKFTVSTVCLIALQMLNRIENLHKHHYLHRDIKPENFLIGMKEKSNVIYLIDFGLSKRYKNPKTHQHIAYREGRSLTGTARYVSINTHLGIEQSRRDDLESIGYVLVYFLKGSLPWQGLKNGNDKYARIMEKKLQIPTDILCYGLPDEMTYYLNYCKSLRFEDRPDYDFLRGLFIKLLGTCNSVYGLTKEMLKFDWCFDDPVNSIWQIYLRKPKAIINQSNFNSSFGNKMESGNQNEGKEIAMKIDKKNMNEGILKKQLSNIEEINVEPKSNGNNPNYEVSEDSSGSGEHNGKNDNQKNVIKEEDEKEEEEKVQQAQSEYEETNRENFQPKLENLAAGQLNEELKTIFFQQPKQEKIDTYINNLYKHSSPPKKEKDKEKSNNNNNKDKEIIESNHSNNKQSNIKKEELIETECNEENKNESKNKLKGGNKNENLITDSKNDEDAPSKHESPKHASPKHASSKHESQKQGSSKQGSPKKEQSKKELPKQEPPKQGPPKQGLPKQGPSIVSSESSEENNENIELKDANLNIKENKRNEKRKMKSPICNSKNYTEEMMKKVEKMESTDKLKFKQVELNNNKIVPEAESSRLSIKINEEPEKKNDKSNEKSPKKEKNNDEQKPKENIKVEKNVDNTNNIINNNENKQNISNSNTKEKNKEELNKTNNNDKLKEVSHNDQQKYQLNINETLKFKLSPEVTPQPSSKEPTELHLHNTPGETPGNDGGKSHRRPSQVVMKISKEYLIKISSEPVQNYYSIVKDLGHGSYGQVKKVKHKSLNEIRAMKITNKKSDSSKYEIEILRKISHPNITNIFEIFADNKKYYIIMEFLEGGELFEAITSIGSFTEVSACKVMRQVLQAVYYLHSNNIVHRDLKPENIMLTSKPKNGNYQIKLIDFGTAKIFKPGHKMNKFIGTSYYIAPEVLKENYDEKCDVWSCGVILYILLCGYPPFNGNNNVDIFHAIQNQNPIFGGEEWEEITPEAKELIKVMLRKNPNERWTAEMCLKHKWFRMLDDTKRDAKNYKQIQMNAINHLSQFVNENRLKQAVFQFITTQFNVQKEEGDLRELFKSMDTSNTGQLTKQEFTTKLAELYGENDGVILAESIFQSLDLDGSGKISYDEFLAAMISTKKVVTEERLQKAFKMFDKDNSGKLSIPEIKGVFGGNENQWKNVIDEVDLNNDGEVDYDEFKIMMKNMNKNKIIDKPKIGSEKSNNISKGGSE